MTDEEAADQRAADGCRCRPDQIAAAGAQRRRRRRRCAQVRSGDVPAVIRSGYRIQNPQARGVIRQAAVLEVVTPDNEDLIADLTVDGVPDDRGSGGGNVVVDVLADSNVPPVGVKGVLLELKSRSPK